MSCSEDPNLKSQESDHQPKPENFLVFEDGKYVFKAESQELIYNQHPHQEYEDLGPTPRQSEFDVFGGVSGLNSPSAGDF